ncbi:hypothetical protein NUH16_006283 [Penicillium rubens]|nr:hypothetical protein CBS147337_10133 [Penicillium roqueforti]KAJ5034838.1 hypothetical protein NUH16_006283 [Penicillium rubens]
MPAPPPLPPRALAGKASPKPRGNILQSSGPPTRVTKAPRGSKSQLRVEIPPSSNRYHSSLTTSQDLQSTKRCQEEVDWEAEHHDCLMYLEQADAEARKLKEEINNTKSEDSQSMQQLRGENTQATANLRRITSDHAKTQQKCSDLAEEIAQLKQQLETTVLTSQNQVAWGDIQPVLRETHTNLLSAAHGIWSTMESLRNKQLATFLPGPGVYRAPWVDEIAPLDVLGSSAAQPDQYPSLA